jgi:hypothetical protein
MFGAAGKSARSWSAPVLWRFDHARGMNNGRNLVLSLLTIVGKAVEGYRSPRRCATMGAMPEALDEGEAGIARLDVMMG